MKNTEISKLLGEEWRNCPAHVRQPHINKEKREREEYHRRVAIWQQNRKPEDTTLCQLGAGEVRSVTVHNGQVEAMEVNLPSTPSSIYPTSSAGFQLSPREFLPIAPKEPEKVSPPISRENQLSIDQVDALLVPGWKTEAVVQHIEAEESLIPTILPSVDTPSSPLQLSSKHLTQEFLDTATKFAQPSTNFPLPSDEANDQPNFEFPNIFQGDTAFDPPIS